MSEPNQVTNLPAVTTADFMPVLDIPTAIARRDALVEVASKIMKDNVDYGLIPGTEKKNLLQPGAEKLISFFGLTPIMELVDKVEDWTGVDHKGEAFFFYRYRCTMKRGDRVLGVEEASANSWEVKHRYRWVPAAQVPAHLNPDTLVKKDASAREPAFAITKRETTGKYGKPKEYWDRFDRAIMDGTAKKVKQKKKDGGDMEAWEIPDVIYRVPNFEAPDLVNTIMQMAEKRAKVRATRSCTGASEFFTQDMEDMQHEVDANRAAAEAAAAAQEGTVIEGSATRVDETKDTAKKSAGKKAAPQASPSVASADSEVNSAAAPAGAATDPKAQAFYEDEAILKLKESRTMLELTAAFNSLPMDVRRPRTKVYEEFRKLRDSLMPKAAEESAEEYRKKSKGE